MEEKKPVVDNSDIIRVDINDILGDAFQMVKVEDAEPVNILKEESEDE